MSAKKVSASFFVFVFTMLVYAGLTHAADIRQVQEAWNRGDSLGVQKGFSRAPEAALSQAQAGYLAEQGGKIDRVVFLRTGVYGARLGDKTLIFGECEDKNSEWCYFGSRVAGTLGGAEYGQLADIGTTAIGLAQSGATEANPLGLAVLPIKLGARYLSRNMEWQECTGWRASFDISGLGAGLANASTLLLGTGLPISLVVMGITSFARWDSAVEQAMFECASYKLNSPLTYDV
jgi:hypothetical protein